MSEMTTPATEIAESFRAIQTAAAERHAALLREAEELETMFPTLANSDNNGGGDESRPRRVRRSFTMEQRADYLRRYHASGLNVYQASKVLGVSNSVLAYWLAREKATNAPQQQEQALVGAH